MINLLRADLYRLVRSKSFYICTLILVVFAVLTGVMIKHVESTAGNQKTEGSISVEVEKTDQALIKSGTEFALSAPTEMDLVGMLLAIMITIFIAVEFNERTMKCIVAKGYSRGMIYVSKAITLSIATVLMLTAFIMISFITGLVISGKLNSISREYAFEAVRFLAVAYLLYLALASVFILMNFIFRNMAVSMAVNICGLIFIPNILGLVEKYFDIPLTKYTLMHAMSRVENLSASTGKVVDVTLLACAYIIMCLIVGILQFRRADIK